MEMKSVLNNAMLTMATVGCASAFADAPSTDPRYDRLKEIMRDYVQHVALDECSSIEGFDFNAYEWETLEIKGLEVVLFDILNHTKNYCKPPELTGMHSARQNQGEDGGKQKEKPKNQL